MTELRRFRRAAFERDIAFSGPEPLLRRTGIARDLSLGGMFIACEAKAPLGAAIDVFVVFDGAKEKRLPAIVRWANDDGMGVQFQLLGAVETHAITEVLRRASKG